MREDALLTGTPSRRVAGYFANKSVRSHCRQAATHGRLTRPPGTGIHRHAGRNRSHARRVDPARARHIRIANPFHCSPATTPDILCLEASALPEDVRQAVSALMMRLSKPITPNTVETSSSVPPDNRHLRVTETMVGKQPGRSRIERSFQCSLATWQNWSGLSTNGVSLLGTHAL